MSETTRAVAVAKLEALAASVVGPSERYLVVVVDAETHAVASAGTLTTDDAVDVVAALLRGRS